MPAHSIGEVVEELSAIVEFSRRESSRLGFFAALYRKVTINVKEGIAAGRFQDGPRMERLDVNFANRYLDAYDRFTRGESTTNCWLVSFRAAKKWRPIVLQHLLVGINAHINFDLGVAAATTCPGDELPPLEHDFNEINVILDSLIQQVQDEIGEVSPWIALLDRIGGRTEDALVKFSMTRARDAAWQVAQQLAPLPVDRWQPRLDLLDRAVSTLGRLVLSPGLLLDAGLWLIRVRESNDLPRIIDVLSK